MAAGNQGIKKRCDCARAAWTKCPHPWHFGFYHRGQEYRFSLHAYAEKLPDYAMSKTEALALRDRARIDIRAGQLQKDGTRKPLALVEGGADGPTVATLLDVYQRRHVEVPSRKPAAQARFRSMLNQLRHVEIPGPEGAVLFASKPLSAVTKSDIEAVREARRSAARALEAKRVAAQRAGTAGPPVRRLTQGGEVGINRLLQVLRHMFNWAVDEGIIEASPFKRGHRTVVKLIKEHGRTRRLQPGEEARLLAAAGPHLRALLEALLSTGCRVGELLNLQWQDVRGDDHGRPILIELPAYKTKTNETRTLPVNARLGEILAFRRNDPEGDPLPPEAYVFGNEVGERIASVKTAWRAACERAGVEGLRLHDLRREVGSRLLECAAPLHEVRDVLGHANVSMTSRYLKSATSGLARTLDRLAEWKDGGGIRTPFAHEAEEADESDAADGPEAAESEELKIGSSGWIRTSNPPVNSRMLCR